MTSMYRVRGAYLFRVYLFRVFGEGLEDLLKSRRNLNNKSSYTIF